MPKASILQSAFNAGELSPLMYGRTDSPRYKQGLATALNYIPTLQGPIVRRPATQYAAEVKDSSNPPVLIPFTFSENQANILEFGNLYIRFYADEAQMVTSGSTYRINGFYGPTNYSTYDIFWGPFYACGRPNTYPTRNEIIETNLPISSGTILEITSPYLVADVPNIRFAQYQDVIYLFHPNYPVWKLTRLSQQEWNLDQVFLQDGPYLALNTVDTEADAANFTLGVADDGLSLVANPTVSVSGIITDPAGSGYAQVTTSADHGYVSGQKVFITGVAGTTEANCFDTSAGPDITTTSWVIEVNGATTFILIGCDFTNAYASGGTCYPAIFDLDAQALVQNEFNIPSRYRPVGLNFSGARYWGFVGGDTLNPVNNAAQISFSWGPGVSDANNGSAASTWYLGKYYGAMGQPFYGGNGYPSCGTFHQGRLVLGGSPGNPQDVDMSETGLYESFAISDPTTLEADDSYAIQETLSSSSINTIDWFISSAQGLLAGTASTEWAIAPSSTSEALTSSNFNAFQTSYYGSYNAEAVPAGNAAIYIQRAQRKVREMNFFFQVGTFRSTDLTELSEHITLPTISKIVYQKETQPLLWGLRSDGNLISMIYDRTDFSLTSGWTRHQLGGQSDSGGTNPIVTSIAVIPSSDTTFDQLWMVVKRYINGETVYFVEYMTKIFDDSMLQEDAVQGDCGDTYYAPETITGISIASTCVVTSASHGFSNGDLVKIVGVVGLNKSTTDINGNTTISNLVNENVFTVEGVTTNTFELYNSQGNPVSSTGYSVWVSGGAAAKLVTSISGVTWLEGETVGVLTDGGNHPDVTITSGGVLNLQYPAAKVQFGYRFLSQGQLLRVDAGAADGTSIGKTRRTTRAALMLHRVGDMSIGTSFTNLLDVPQLQAQGDNQQADTAIPLYSGIVREGIESAYDFESQICFQQSSMLPGMVQAVVSFMEEQDV